VSSDISLHRESNCYVAVLHLTCSHISFLSLKQNCHIIYIRSLNFYQEDYIVLSRQNQIIQMHDRFNLYKSLLKNVKLQYLVNCTRSSDRQKNMCNFMSSVLKKFTKRMKAKGSLKIFFAPCMLSHLFYSNQLMHSF
jgi:hypothetical protein